MTGCKATLCFTQKFKVQTDSEIDRRVPSPS